MLSVVMLSVVMLSVVMLSVVMLNVVAPVFTVCGKRLALTIKRTWITDRSTHLKEVSKP